MHVGSMYQHSYLMKYTVKQSLLSLTALGPVYIEVGNPRRWGNQLGWGNLPVHTITHFNLIKVYMIGGVTIMRDYRDRWMGYLTYMYLGSPTFM